MGTIDLLEGLVTELDCTLAITIAHCTLDLGIATLLDV